MKMSLKSMGLLWLLRTRGSMSLHQILETCTDGRDAVKTALQELKTLGLVTMSEYRSRGRFDSCFYSLTISGKSVDGETVIGKSISGERVGRTDFSPQQAKPQTEKPLVENPLTENPLMAELFENQAPIGTVTGKSTNGDENSTSLSISNKGNNKSNNNTTTLRVEDNMEKEHELNSVEEPGRKRRKRREKAPEVLFRETEFVLLVDGRERFREALIARNPDLEMADTDYYYQRALNWSDNDNRKVNWVATVANWIIDDAGKGKMVKAKTNLHATNNTTIKGVDLDRALERAKRVASRYSE